jgi:hypothetical protein
MLSGKKQIERQKFKDSLEKFRDNKFAKTRQRERFMTGRLYAHLRHDELRKAVQEIQDKEKDASQQSAEQTINDPNLIKEKGIWLEKFEYDDQFKLPYGVGYDAVIKKRTDMIDKQKFWNNRVMDELVNKLGYMDYRDALAANKYILEVKRHGDYHQQARAKILSVAMSKYNALKRADVDSRAAQIATAENLNKDEAKLNLITKEDPEMARLYREAYGDIKKDKMTDYDEADRIFDKFAYMKDKYALQDRKPTKDYNLHEEKNTIEEDMLTTELSDEELDLIYKRYKYMQAQNSDVMREAEEEAQELI